VLTSVSVANASELDTALSAGARTITLTASIDAYSFGSESVADVDIVIPPGIIFSNAILGRWNSGAPDRVFTRVRFRGNTVGTHSGGQLHNLQILFAPDSSDIIFDGLDLTGRGHVFLPTNPADDLARLAFQYNRIHSGGLFIQTKAFDFTVCFNSILTGSDNTQAPGNDEAYAFRWYPGRNGIFYANDIRSSTVRAGGTGYSRFRFHPYDAGGSDAYGWVSNNTIVDRVDSNIFWLNSQAGHSSVDQGDMAAVWFTENLVIAENPAVFQFTFGDSDHAYVQGNTFQSDVITDVSDISAAGGNTTCPDPTFTPNTYAALPGSDPAWGGPGDPSGLDWTIP